MPKMTATQSSEAIIRELGSETLLYIPATKTIHVLNATARLIWSLCDGKHTVDDMERIVREKFSVPENHNVREDIEKVLDELSEKGLIVLS